jgi:hypothetical protein
VDLAGSERLASTAATGDRLKVCYVTFFLVFIMIVFTEVAFIKKYMLQCLLSMYTSMIMVCKIVKFECEFVMISGGSEHQHVSTHIGESDLSISRQATQNICAIP